MTFEDWIKTFPEPLDAPSIGFARMVWDAAQAAERDRIISFFWKGTLYDALQEAWRESDKQAKECINEVPLPEKGDEK